DEYFMYADDLDLCYKLEQTGYSNYYVGSASMIHHGGKSTGQRRVNQWSTVMKFNSIFKFCVKTRGWLYAGMYRAVMGCSAAGRLLLLSPWLMLSAISRKPSRVLGPASKWSAVLKWSLGLNVWALKVR